MNLDTVITQISTYCPSFAGRVEGSAKFRHLDQAAGLTVPHAFIIPLDDNPGERMSLNDMRQPLIESFSVVIAIDNTLDEYGKLPVNLALDTIRAELWAALLGWQPDPVKYRGVEYQGGNLIEIDRSRLWYQYDFGAYMEISPSDGWQAIELDNAPHFDGVTITFSDNLDGAPRMIIKDPKTGILP